MVVSIALWSIEIKAGAPQTFVVPNDLRVTNAALGEELADEKARTSVKLSYKLPKPEDSEDEEEEEEEEDEVEEAAVTTVLCSLTPGKIEHATLDLVLEEDQEVTFEVAGKNTVYLSGNFVDQTPAHDHGDGLSDISDEEDYDLGEIGSELDLDEDDSHRFEEAPEEAPKKSDSKKRPRESEAMEVDEPKLSKAEKKKLNKKLKGENGEAVAPQAAEAEKPKEKKEKKEKKESSEKPKKAEAKELAHGVKAEDHKVGTGAQAKNGDYVSMRYVGKLANGKVFDSNTKDKPFKFRLGKGEVIKGWDIGVAGMQVGGERKIIIPPAAGYGKKGNGSIPPNSTLTFEVKLIGIK